MFVPPHLFAFVWFTDKLFSLMLELSSMDEVSPELSSISSGCLISLAIASGETAKLLAAANCLLLTLPDNSAQTRVLPVHESFKIRLF